MRPRLATALTFALLLLTTGTVAGSAGADADEGDVLAWSPDPVPPETPLTVRFTPPDGGAATNVTLKVCLADHGNATYCYPLAAMDDAGDGGFSHTTDPRWALPPQHQVGLNVSWVDADGLDRYWPMGIEEDGRAYVFFTTTAATRDAPAPAAVLALAAVATAAAVAGIRLRRRQ